MPDAIRVFHANMAQADALTGLFDYLTSEVRGPACFDDLLRSKLVYAVSAFDKLIHDVVREGMVEIFIGKRKPTRKYLAETIPLDVVAQLSMTTELPREILFEQTVRSKLKVLSFQDPDKVADGLAYIWDEAHKWKEISSAIAADETTTRTTLKLIATRRNSIVHEADIDPVSETKNPITRSEVEDVGALLRRVGDAIHTICTAPNCCDK